MSLKGSLAHRHFWIKIIMWVVVTICFSLMVGLVMPLLPSLTTPSGIRWVQLVQMILSFLLPPLVMAYLLSDQPLQWLYLRKSNAYAQKWRKSYWLWAVGLMLIAQPAINLLGHINSQLALPSWLSGLEQMMKSMEESAAVLTDSMLSTDSVLTMLANLLIIGSLPAVAEELTFRGVLQRLFQTSADTSLESAKVPHLAIWVTAIIFSAIHMQFYGFVPRMLMGALFGYMLVWTGSMWIPMLMHFVNNGIAVLLYFISNKAGWDLDKIDGIGTDNTLWIGVVSIVLTIGGIYAFRRSTTMSNASSRISSGS
jgi:membrane protease YdiL (CAAX protease family)